MRLSNRLVNLIFVGLAALAVMPAQAQTQVHGTRVVYPAEEREVTISVDNVGTTPRLLQVWVDDGDAGASADTAKAPFLLTPPMSRVEPGKGQSFRLMFTGGDVPQDRESVYWFNVLEIPPKPQTTADTANYLQFAVRTRLKIFYRPKGLQGDPASAMAALQWRLVRDGKGVAMECTNPSAFNVSVANIRFKGTEEMAPSANRSGGMCTAKGTLRMEMPTQDMGNGKIIFNAINDFGGFEEHEAAYAH